MIVKAKLYQLPGTADVKQRSVSTNEYLKQVGLKHGIDKCINRSITEANHKKLIADTIEAVLGAVFRDSDYDIKAVSKVMKVLGLEPEEKVDGDPHALFTLRELVGKASINSAQGGAWW